MNRMVSWFPQVLEVFEKLVNMQIVTLWYKTHVWEQWMMLKNTSSCHYSCMMLVHYL